MRASLRVLSRLDGARAERLVAEVREAAAAAPSVLEAAVERLAEAPLSTRLVLVQFLGLLADERGAVPILLAPRDVALGMPRSSARSPNARSMRTGRSRRPGAAMPARCSTPEWGAMARGWGLDESDRARTAAVRGSSAPPAARCCWCGFAPPWRASGQRGADGALTEVPRS
jgi:hypothetical protein